MDKVYQNWHWKTDDEQILWLSFDKANASVNAINRTVMQELDSILETVAKDTTYKALVITSAKATGFIAGADIEEFDRFKEIQDAYQILRHGQTVFNKIEKLKIPTVAMIEGFCLGGGLELALACRYRVVEEGPKTRLGLPEVKLGIHPGWGGSVRVVRLLGPLQGLNLVLSGHTISGKAAAKLGLADAALPKRQLTQAAKFYALKHPEKKRPLWHNLTEIKLSRQIIAYFIRKKLRAKANPLHYPAPFDALNNWEHVGVEDEIAYEQEAKSCSKLFFSETSRNLVRCFFLQEKLKGLAKDIRYTPKHIHVIGAGMMGGDIAAWCAQQGFTVTLQDLEPRLIAPAIKRAAKLYQEKFKEKYLQQNALDRLIPDVDGYGIAKADIIIEAVVEDLTIKQKIFKMVEEKAKPDAILATNTSSIPLDEINTILNDPSRLIGIHFFNPVAKMMLVEVVQGEKTNANYFEKAISFVRKIDRLPLPVKSSPGFLVNRILMPYLLESMELLMEGVPMTTIDKAMTDFGMPMGPITLADTVGLDVCLSVAKYLGRYYKVNIPARLEEMVAQRKLGKKVGAGFYKYDKNGKPVKFEVASYDKPLEEIANRLVLSMLNEAFACLREGVVANGNLLDAGMIFGTGFAPFRGGPIHYAKSQGIAELYQQYLKQSQARGEVSQTWDAMDA